MGIFSSSHFISQFPPTRFPLITAIRMCHFLPVHHLGMAFLAGSKDQNITFLYLSFYCKGSKRVTQGLRVRWSWTPSNINWNILTPFFKLMAVNVVSFSFFWCSTGALGSTLMGAGFLYCILSASSLDPNSSGLPEGPFGRVWLSLPHLHSNSVRSSTQLAVELNWII